MMVPLLLAYKLKFFTLIPVLTFGLILLVKSAGLVGFFFAMFACKYLVCIYFILFTFLTFLSVSFSSISAAMAFKKH